jgi:hypothetical protein
LPELLVESNASPVKSILPIVGFEGILYPVKGKPGSANPIGIPPHQGAQVGALAEVARQVIVPKDHIAEITPSIWDQPGENDSAIVGDTNHHPGTILQSVDVGNPSIWKGAEVIFLD